MIAGETAVYHLVRAVTSEAAAVACLHELNAQRVRALAEGDRCWFDDNLSGDFVCTRADGRRIGKAEFLQQTGEWPLVDVACDDVDVRPLGDVALVQGVLHCTGDSVGLLTRYTDVWRLLDSGWQMVAAQLTPVGGALK